MRVAIYARVSSERQEKEHTIGSQLEALRNYAAQNGMEIVEEFTDEGYSGARLDRPALDRVRPGTANRARGLHRRSERSLVLSQVWWADDGHRKTHRF